MGVLVGLVVGSNLDKNKIVNLLFLVKLLKN